MGYNIHERKDITIPLIIHYFLFTESIQNTTQIFLHAKS